MRGFKNKKTVFTVEKKLERAKLSADNKKAKYFKANFVILSF